VKLPFTPCAATLCLALTASMAGAQKAPRRPQLPEGADTNDANAYYFAGLQVLDHDPEQAAADFYWSARINPGDAPAFYARRVALLLEDPYRLVKYWEGDKGTVRDKDVMRIDSLYYHALTLDPFVPERLERNIFDAVLDQLSSDLERETGASAGDIQFQLDQYMFDAPAALRAYRAHAEGDLQGALKLYAEAITSADVKAPMRIDRATVFFETAQFDSALVELETAAREMQKRDDKDLVYVYQSKALLDQRIAVVDLHLGRVDSARAALGQALQEDLSYSPAHVYLAGLAMQAHDTATALSEMDLAVQLRPDDPFLQNTYGFMLINAGRPADAEFHLREAIRLDDVYAAPHWLLARVLDKPGNGAAAAAEYTTFISLAMRSDPSRAAAQTRLKALQPGGGSPPEPRP
jgi:tetratricopeptide (TPR) repeat protein